MGSKVLSDGTTEVSFDGESINIIREFDGESINIIREFDGESINIIREGDFEGETIPVNLWGELKQAVDDLILDQG